MASQRGSCYEPSRAPARHHKSDVFLCPRRTAREATDPPRGAAPPRPRRGRPSLLERWVEGLQSTGNCEQNGLPTFLILWRWRAGERLAMAETAAEKVETDLGRSAKRCGGRAAGSDKQERKKTGRVGSCRSECPRSANLVTPSTSVCGRGTVCEDSGRGGREGSDKGYWQK